jgi:hypothetical protein
MNAPAGPLFRPEVAEARAQRVFGEIVLTQPTRTRLLVALICAVTALLAAWVALGSYTRTEVARGFIVTDAASAKVVALRPGIVTELLVRDGDVVRDYVETTRDDPAVTKTMTITRTSTSGFGAGGFDEKSQTTTSQTVYLKPAS